MSISMVIVRSPYRASFFGGGTDYPVFADKFGGAVLSAAIDKYCWITARRLPPFFPHRSRIVWSEIELVRVVEEIRHPSARACMRYLGTEDVEIHYDGDLPAGSGMGSSSAFTVSLLHALHALNGAMVSKQKLAEEAVRVERDMLKLAVGTQDQVAASFGGFNRIDFPATGGFVVTPIVISSSTLYALQERLMLFYSGHAREASEVAAEQVRMTPQKESELRAMRDMVDLGLSLLARGDLAEFGALLWESWILKRSLTPLVSTPEVDRMCEAAMGVGALGCKLLGAGSGGFVLVFAEPRAQREIRAAMGGKLEVPFKFDFQGSRIVHYEPECDYAALAVDSPASFPSDLSYASLDRMETSVGSLA